MRKVIFRPKTKKPCDCCQTIASNTSIDLGNYDITDGPEEVGDVIYDGSLSQFFLVMFLVPRIGLYKINVRDQHC